MFKAIREFITGKDTPDLHVDLIVQNEILN